jgi:predicted Fe-Mo cluster-binding NifX family protein
MILKSPPPDNGRYKAMYKILMPIEGEEIAPRFDLATEVWLGWINDQGELSKESILVLPQASAEDLCQLILNEGVEVVICGGIENEYYEYLCWKKITVYDSVIALYSQALRAVVDGRLHSGAILYNLS